MLQKIRQRQAAFQGKRKPEATAEASKQIQRPQRSVSLDFQDSEPLPYTVHYHMSKSTKFFENITKWLGENKDDVALRVCCSPLKFLCGELMKL
jgi:hypothetical protein